MITKKFLINGNHYLSFVDDLDGGNLCLEVQFILIPNDLTLEIDKVLEKYQIKIVKYLDKTYILNLFAEKNFELPQMANKIMNGFNDNEVIIIPKNPKKIGFFEKFFQLFR